MAEKEFDYSIYDNQNNSVEDSRRIAEYHLHDKDDEIKYIQADRYRNSEHLLQN